MLSKLYTNKDILDKYPEQTFVELKVDIGLQKPILFISNKFRLKEASYYSQDPIEEQNYDINIISSGSSVLMYLINIKAPMFKVYHNGLLIRNRLRWDNERDMDGVSTRYTFEDFLVISNKNQTSSIFCKSVVSEQKT